MKQTQRILCLGITLVLGLSLSGCRNKPEEGIKNEEAEGPAPLAIILTPEAFKLAGIETAEAVLRPVVRTIRAPGEICFNPKRLAHVTARAAGRIEQISVYPGDRVQKGQWLISFYSQDFLALQAELLQAVERFKRLQGEPAEKAAAQSLLESARSRLRLFDVSDADLAEIEKTGSLKPLLSVRAPLAGIVIESPVTNGDYVELGASLFKIADLSTVWMDVHIFEKDIPGIRIGSDVTVRAAAFPGRESKGRIFQIGSVVDGKTRTVEGRVELANPDGQIRPGMFVEADIISPSETRSLFVPGAAVQDYQNNKIVFIRTNENTFILREVETGISLDGFIEILKGLKERDTVTANGSFFLKSELLKKSLGEEQP